MKRKYTREYWGYTWQGLTFGIFLMIICFVIFSTTLMITLKHFLFPGMSTNMGGINGGLIGGLSVLSFKYAKWYWEWADRVMAKLFGSNDSKQEK